MHLDCPRFPSAVIHWDFDTSRPKVLGIARHRGICDERRYHQDCTATGLCRTKTDARTASAMRLVFSKELGLLGSVKQTMFNSDLAGGQLLESTGSGVSIAWTDCNQGVSLSRQLNNPLKPCRLTATMIRYYLQEENL
jgi:hypothetical protein